MKLKSLVVAVLVLAALSGGAYLLNRPAPPPAADTRLQQALVAANLIEQAARVRLSDAGKTVELARQPDGTWKVPSYHDMAADFSKLSGFVGNLTEAKLQRLVTSNPERIARLEFKDTKIELLGTDGKATFSVTLGKNPETGGGRFVRFGDENKAYLASLNAWIDGEARNWANPELISLKLDDLARVEIPFAEGGPLVISRAKKEDPWTADRTPEGQRVKADKIGSLLSTLATVRFTESTATDDANATAAKANQRTFKVATFDNKTVTLALGRKLAKKDDAKAGEPKKDDKPLAPEFETIPAGPVFAHITHSEGSQPINALMQKRAFQIAEYSLTSLPQKPEELFEPIPPPPSAPAPAPPAEAPKKP
jgi:hypothetical protein